MKTGEINKYGNSISGLIPKIPKGIVNKYDIENDKFQSEFFTPTGGTSILGDPVPLNHYMYSTRFSNCYMFKPNKNSTYKYSSYEEFKYNFSVNGKSYLTYEYPWIYSEDITWPKMFDFFNIKYDKNIPENELRFKYRNEIEKICRKWKAPSGTGLREAYKKALNYLSNYDNNNIYYHEIRYANAEQHLRLNLRAFDSACKLVFENYKRDPKFNYPGYIEKKLDLSYLPIKYSTKAFNCWGIGHDCIIQTADGVRCRWDFKRQKLIKL